MCHEFLSKFSNRNKSDWPLEIRRKLKKVFKELANRSGSQFIGRDEFLRFTELPGLLGEQVFNALDEDEDNKLDAKEFVLGIYNLYSGHLNSVTDFLFKLFNFSRNGQINNLDIKCILEYLPTKCKKCSKPIETCEKLAEKISSLFEYNKYLLYEDFHDRILEDNELGEHVLMCILSLMPEIFDAIFVSGYKSEVLIESFFEFKKRKYFGVLKNKAIFYSLYKSGVVKGIILANDLFVEAVENCGFLLKSNKFSYEFRLETGELQEKWLEKLKIVSNHRDIFQSYTISKNTIGKGAYGKVKLASKIDSEEVFAIKIISKEPLDPRSETRLRREITILKILSHENIVKLKDIFETPKKLYIITEYVQGGSLFSWLKSKGFKIDEKTSKILIHQIASAVSYLHSYGICHRDIKLENILLDTSNGLKPKIIDFGLSCILGPGQYSQEAVGTLKYASPELISRIPYRETPDVWGIGVILYILLTGKSPFYGENDQEIVNRILNKKIDVENERWNGISNDAKDVVVRLLTRKPSDRMNLENLLAHSWFDDVGSDDL